MYRKPQRPVSGRRNLLIEGCYILARQFCERIEGRDAKAATLIGQNRICSLQPVLLTSGPTGDQVADARIR